MIIRLSQKLCTKINAGKLKEMPLDENALRRLMAAGISLDGASDRGVSKALYLRDPDDNGIELYWDRPQDQWPRSADRELAMFTRRLDLNQLLQEAEAKS